MKTLWQLTPLSALLFLFCSCAVGPDYRRPDVAPLTPPEWRWKIAEPKDAVPKGEWWRVFRDPPLDELESGAVARGVITFT